MTATAATATDLPGLFYAVVVTVVLAGLYVLECWWWPYGKCGKCEGTGKRWSPDGKHFRDCPRCDGRGRRIRIGRRIWNFLRIKTDDS